MTNPYHSQQNGIAECAIAVIMEMVRSMLHGTKMDLWYWGEAFMYAIYIHFVMPISTLQGKIPYTKWYGQKPDLAHL